MKNVKRFLMLVLALAFVGATTMGAAPGQSEGLTCMKKSSVEERKALRLPRIEEAAEEDGQPRQLSSGAARRAEARQSVQTAAPAPVQEQPKLTSASFTAYAYCACSKCCGKWANGITATGTRATQGRTIAVDPKIIPLGARVWVNGREYIAEDTGVSGYTIDVFHSSHQAALQFGKRTVTVQWEAK